MKKVIFTSIVLSLCTLQSAQPREQASFTHNAATLAKQLPILHSTLTEKGKSITALIEFLEHVTKTHHATNTWNLKEGARYFTRDLLQMLDTIAGEQSGQQICTILLQGNPGTLPISLIAASLLWIGKKDVAITCISQDPIPSRRQLHKMIRTFLSKSDRCFVYQFHDVAPFAKASRSWQRMPNIVISFTGQPELLQPILRNPLVFDYTNRTVK